MLYLRLARLSYSYDKIHIIIQQAYIINQYIMKNNVWFILYLNILFSV